jgi:hypothetical protein
LNEQFNAAVVMAQAALAVLVGAAPNAKVTLQRHYDVNPVSPIPATAASQIKVLVAEYWT